MIERLDHLVMTVADIARTVDCFQGRGQIAKREESYAKLKHAAQPDVASCHLVALSSSRTQGHVPLFSTQSRRSSKGLCNRAQ
jgi:hypothetical protein